MSVFQSEDRLRLKRLRSEKAIQLAMQNRWEEAVDLNRQILELFADDVDTHNRLGKALLELGRYAESREAYEQAARLDPSSTIAQKNIQRLTKLIEEEAPAPPSTPLDPRLFIEESGRTVVTTLVDLGSPEVLAKLTAGDQLKVEPVENRIKVLDLTDGVVGQLEPKLAQRVTRLLEIGNRYSAAVTSVDDESVRVILRETHRDPSMGNRPSFPASVVDAGRAYTRDILRYDLEETDEDLTEEIEPDEEPAEAELEEGAAADEADEGEDGS
jgi:tetratricopeptide (TPR) repeat protein